MSRVSVKQKSSPAWDDLFAVAQAQLGYFTTKQAAAAGYSPQLLYKYLDNGRVIRVRHGIYRLVHFPSAEEEDLVVLWLWAVRVGVFSHETALALHDLSDLLPSKVHLTVPAAWRRRRLRVPSGLVLHHADLADADQDSYGAVPVTTPYRTLNDCIKADVAPDHLAQAILQTRQRGLISKQQEAQLRNDLDRIPKAHS